MRKLVLLLLVPVLALVACSPDESAIQTAIAQTAEAVPTNTPEPKPTSTSAPTSTPAPSATPSICTAQSPDYFTEMETIWERWEDAEEVAFSTARIALVTPIQELQAIRREVGNLDPPTCAADLHALQLDYMQDIIDNFLDFAADDPETLIELGFIIAGIKAEGIASHLAVAKGESSSLPNRVHYVVFVAGLHKGARLDFYDAEGHQRMRVESPWVHTFIADADTQLSLIAYPERDALATCTIFLDGVELVGRISEEAESAVCVP